ncbi:hypothetical protein D9758_007865 [Tetrapyrgos nigripes]|uniref:Uncharacterized protein n=1 Tax=Tetrapyrgos nigripes TaxID=182062 RepID=A0A8H5FXK5_9AGAR|nr:hypothetical protein D9758_007865 [Tetrapyrgos nigripes]
MDYRATSLLPLTDLTNVALDGPEKTSQHLPAANDNTDVVSPDATDENDNRPPFYRILGIHSVFSSPQHDGVGRNSFRSSSSTTYYDNDGDNDLDHASGIPRLPAMPLVLCDDISFYDWMTMNTSVILVPGPEYLDNDDHDNIACIPHRLALDTEYDGADDHDIDATICVTQGIPPSSTPFEDSTLSASGASHSVDRARTPSPTGSFTSAPLPNPHPATRSQTPTLRDRAERPSSRPSSMLMMHPSGELLVPPHPHAPAGPRSPGHGQLAHSPGSTQSPPSQYHQPPSRTPSPRTPVLDLNFATSTESTLNGKHDGHVDVLDGTGSLRRLQDIGNGHKKLDNEEEDAQTPIKPSAKALGKRKIVEAPTHDSTVHERTENSEERSGWGGVEVDQDGEIGMFKTNGEYTANDGSSIHESYDGKGRLESEDWDDKSSLYGAGDDSESDDSRDRAEYDRNRWILKHMMHPPVHFVYDAVAERTKEWLKEGMKGIEIQKESEMKNKETAVVGG